MALRFLNSGYFAGNVGIGTDNPSAKLEVSDDNTIKTAIHIDNTSTGGHRWDIASIGSGVSGRVGNLQIRNDSDTLNIVEITGDGNVGIGTTSPSGKLEVNGIVKIGNVTTGLSMNGSSATEFLISGADTGGNAWNSIHIKADGNDGLFIEKDTNNVGIGTTSPAAGLQVALGGTTIPAAGASTASAVFGNSTSDDNYGVAIGANSSGVGYISSQRTDGTATTYNLAIQPNGGNVGIGTTSPQTKLHVEGLTRITEGGNTAFYSGNYVRLFNSQAYQFRNSGGSVIANINLNGDSYFNGGDVGINTTSPDFKLDVEGTFGVSDLPFNTDSVSVLVADETIGADLVTNGDFATNTDWTEQGGAAAWSIANGKANCVVNSSTRYFEQPNVLLLTGPGNTYKVVYTISGITQGQFQINIGGYGATPGRTTNGTYAETFTTTNASSNNRIYLQSNPNTIGSIDNVSVQLVTSASNQIQKRELGTGAFGPTPVGAYLPLAAGSGSPLTGALYVQDHLILQQDGTNDLIKSTGNVLYHKANEYSFQDNSNNGWVTIKNGDVGIGTTSPNAKLSIRNDGTQLSLQRADSLGTEWGFYSWTSGLNIFPAAASEIYIGRDGATTNLQLHNGILKVLGTGNSYFTGNVGIGVTSPGAKLDIVGGTIGLRIKKANLSDVLRVYTQGSGIFMDSGNVHISDDLKIGATLLSNQENTDIDSAAAEVVAQVSTTYTAAFFDFVVKKTTNVRSGTVYACHDGTNVEFTETSTNDLGDTSDVTLSVDISGTNMRLLATVTSDDWSVKSLIRAI